MKKYKIQLFNFVPLDNSDYFLWVTNEALESKLKIIQLNCHIDLFHTDDRYDKEEDLDLMKAKAWHNRLTKLGVNCEIVEIDY